MCSSLTSLGTLAHNLCLESDWPDGQTFHSTAEWHGGLLIPVSGVDDAEGRVREQVLEEKIGGSEQHGTFKRDMIRDGMILRHAQH